MPMIGSPVRSPDVCSTHSFGGGKSVAPNDYYNAKP
jgi:hypothetical protein